MPQFVQTQQRGVDPALASLQQQAGARRDISVESARLGAGQYMKNFRQDAADAGYSLGEWAQRNEQGVKSALFTLSGNDQGMMEAKYAELAGAPESFEQKKQRLLDIESKKGPEELFGTVDTFKEEQKLVPGKPATEAVGMDISSFRDETKGMRNILDAGKVLFGTDVNLAYGSGTPESEQFFQWRKNTAKAYGLDNFTGGADAFVDMPDGTKIHENEWLMNMIQQGDPSGAVEIEAVPSELDEKQTKNLTSIVADDKSFRPGSPETLEAIKERIATDPAFKEASKQAALEVLAMGGKIPLTGSPFTSWTPELFESLFETGSTGGTYQFRGSLPALKFEGTEATPDSVINVQVLDKKGVPGFIQHMESTFQKVVEQGGAFGAQEENAILSARRQAEQDVLTAKTNADRNVASAQLMQAQAYEAMSRASAMGSPDLKVYQKAYFDGLAVFKKTWTEKAIKAILPGSIEERMYRAEIDFLGSLSNMGGFGTGFTTLERDRMIRENQEFAYPGAVGKGGPSGNAEQTAENILNQ